jgi:FKBP-type peptidyl-prolyl cis-trans isomerase FkpA
MRVFVVLVAFSFLACKQKKSIDQKAVDEQIITKYISDHQLAARPTGSGLYYVVDTLGSGQHPAANSNVTVDYRGYFTSGVVFDQSPAAGISFNLSGVIKGWQEGIPLFKKGGKGILLIPSALAYGSQGNAKIPANSVLIFDIKLLDVR